MKVALVTGGLGEIGRGIAECFQDDGYTVVVSAHHDPNLKQKEWLAKTKIDCQLADVTKVINAKGIVDLVCQKYGKIDVLINNAGIVKDNLISNMSIDDVISVMQVNFLGPFNMTKAVMEKMKVQNDGCILNMASVSGITGTMGQANYSASKAALINLTKTTAREAGMYHVRCNAVAPGLIDTQMAKSLSPRALGRYLNAILMRRLGTIDEIAKTFLFLATNEYITGQTVVVDGGLTF